MTKALTPIAPGPKWCGTILRCICGNRLTPWFTIQLREQKAIQCAACKSLIDAKAFEIPA